MDRRIALTYLSNALLGIALKPAHADAANLTIQLHPDQHLRNIEPDFIGLGYEISSIATPNLLSARDHKYVRLLRNLSSAGVIRVGGNTSDYALFDSHAPAQALPKATIVNRENMDDLRTFLDATGWKLLWGLNLGQGSINNACAEAKAVAAAAGNRLVAFQIGNEPDLFGRNHRPSSWNYSDYLSEYRKFKTAIRQELPHAKFAGPDSATNLQWVQNFARDEGKDLVLLTTHYYIGNSALASSTIDLMLRQDPRLISILNDMKQDGAKLGLPYRICETNSFYGGGRFGVSNSFGSALWLLDFMFTLLSQGSSGVNIETGVNHLGFISHYSPIGDDGHGNYPIMPEYYGILAFSLAARGSQIGLSFENQGLNLAAYATAKSTHELVLVIINKEVSQSASIRVACGDQRPNQATLIRLSAPSLQASSGVILGGASVDDAGDWKATRTEKAEILDGWTLINAPPASAMVVTLYI